MATERDKARAAILALFARYSLVADDRDFRLAAYWQILSELPPACVIKACEQASRGQVGSPAFPPTCAELYQAALKALVHPARPPLRLPAPEALLLMKMEDRKPDQERERIAKKFKAFAAELRAENPRAGTFHSTGEIIKRFYAEGEQSDHPARERKMGRPGAPAVSDRLKAKLGGAG